MNEVLIYLLKSAALLSVFLGFYWLLLKKDTSFNSNRQFLAGGLIASAVLPAIYFTRTVIIEANQPQLQFAEGNFPVSAIPVQEPLLSPGEILTGIYLLGVTVMLIRLLLQLFSLLKVLSGGRKVSRHGIKFIETQDNIAPFSFLNFIVYNPDLHSEEDLQHILKHEKVHVSQWHTLDVLLANLNLAYQWFNPFAWLYNKNLQQNLEFIADKEAVKAASCKKEYQKTLVKLSVENFSPALTNNFFQSLIKKRIMMLNKQTSGKNNAWKTVLILPALAVFLMVFNTRTVAQVQQTRETRTTSTMEITVPITKNTTNEQLESFKKVMAKRNLMLDFENIKRSNDGLLTAITINFLNTVNNNSGTFTKSDPNGIETFTIKMTGDGKAAFADAAETTGQTHEVLQKLGPDPLYIVKNRQYTSAELDGKTIEFETGYTLLDPENAVKAYGSKAKSGALIFSNGRIIDDLTAELKIIDSKKETVNRKYVKIEQGSRPSFLELQSEFEETSAEAGTATFNTATNETKIPGNPVYIVNGRIVKDADSINEIDPESINEIHVLKGAAATSLYGKKARDGAILITTKPVDTLKTGSFNFKTGTLKLQDTVTGTTRTYYASNLKFTPKPGVTISSTSKDSIGGRGIQLNYNGDRPYTISTDGVKINASQNITGTGTETFYLAGDDPKKPLYVVNGKEADKDIMYEIEPQNIESINVLKGESATEKYGKKGENGVIEITLKKKQE